MDIIAKLKENRQKIESCWDGNLFMIGRIKKINDKIRLNIINNDKRGILLELLIEFASSDAIKIIIDYATHSKYNDVFYGKNIENFKSISGFGPIPLDVIQFDWEYFIKQVGCTHNYIYGTFWNHTIRFCKGCGYKNHIGKLAGRSNLYIQCPICWIDYGFNIVEKFEYDGVVIIKFDQYYVSEPTYPRIKKEKPTTFELIIL